MPRPVCVRCNHFMRVAHNGVYAIEHGVDDPTDQATRTPYRIWMADQFECPICDAVILTAFGKEPVSERHKHGFERWIKDVIEGADHVVSINE